MNPAAGVLRPGCDYDQTSSGRRRARLCERGTNRGGDGELHLGPRSVGQLVLCISFAGQTSSGLHRAYSDRDRLSRPWSKYFQGIFIVRCATESSGLCAAHAEPTPPRAKGARGGPPGAGGREDGNGVSEIRNLVGRWSSGRPVGVRQARHSRRAATGRGRRRVSAIGTERSAGRGGRTFGLLWLSE